MSNENDLIEEGCTPADAKMLRAANHQLAAENEALREALQFYAEGSHFIMHSSEAWDTVSGEPPNFWEDESSTATVEDGSIAKLTLAAHTPAIPDEDETCTLCGQPWDEHEFGVPAPYCPAPKPAHEFAVQPSSGIAVCQHCGLGELAARGNRACGG